LHLDYQESLKTAMEPIVTRVAGSFKATKPAKRK